MWLVYVLSGWPEAEVSPWWLDPWRLDAIWLQGYFAFAWRFLPSWTANTICFLLQVSSCRQKLQNSLHCLCDTGSSRGLAHTLPKSVVGQHALQASALPLWHTGVELVSLPSRSDPAGASGKRRRPALVLSSPASFPPVPVHSFLPYSSSRFLILPPYPKPQDQVTRSPHVNRTIRSLEKVFYFSIKSEKKVLFWFSGGK